MKDLLAPVSELAVSAAKAALPEFVTVGSATLLPRGADAFIGSEKPLVLAATRWAAVSPGGVLVGGSPSALSAVFGFDLPDRPQAGETPPEPPAPTEGEPPAKKLSWNEQIIEAARPQLTTFTHSVATAVSRLAGLPPECAATQMSANSTDAQTRAEVGPVPDAIVVLLHAEEFDVRMVVVVPGIFAARLIRPAEENVHIDEGAMIANPTDDPETVSPLVRVAAGPLDAALADVPLDLAIEIGNARVPLAQVVHLADGEVIELRQRIDAPVDLVAESVSVARGDLEVDDHGNLVLVVTSIPGRDGVNGAPRIVAPLAPEPSALSSDDQDITAVDPATEGASPVEAEASPTDAADSEPPAGIEPAAADVEAAADAAEADAPVDAEADVADGDAADEG